MKRIFWAMCLIATLLSSCTHKKPLLPTISGKAGEVIIVTPTKSDWEGTVGNTVRELLTAECAYLPQSEPLYTLINVSKQAFTKIFQIHRNIVYINISSDVTEPGYILKNDQWAQPQCVILINAADAEGAASIISENSKVILNALEQAERDRIINNSKRFEERPLATAVKEVMGGSPHFPTGYVLKKRTSNFVWIAYETTHVMQGFLIYRYPAVGNESEFTIESIIAVRNEMLKQNVPGMFENTFMTTSQITTPGLEFVRYKGRSFAEVRGLWEVYNDYMGGPFVSHTFYSKDGSELICLEGFVYAPKYDKRHYLRQVESIIYSFEWEEEK